LIPSYSELVVSVVTKRARLFEIRPATLRTRKSHAENGIMDVPATQPFDIKIANFSDDAIFLRTGTLVPSATELQAVIIMKLEENDECENWNKDTEHNENLQKDIQRRAMKVLESHKAMWIDNYFGEITGVEHRIHTKDGHLRQHPYCSGPRMREE
jgi:hypothetical protein